MAGSDGKPAENGKLNIGVETRDMLPIGKGEAVGFQRAFELEQGIGAANFLKGDDVRFEGANAFADLGLRLAGLGRARAAGGVEIIFHVVSSNAKSVRGNQTKARAKEQEGEYCGAAKRGKNHRPVIVAWQNQLKGD